MTVQAHSVVGLAFSFQCNVIEVLKLFEPC